MHTANPCFFLCLGKETVACIWMMSSYFGYFGHRCLYTVIYPKNLWYLSLHVYMYFCGKIYLNEVEFSYTNKVNMKVCLAWENDLFSYETSHVTHGYSLIVLFNRDSLWSPWEIFQKFYIALLAHVFRLVLAASYKKYAWYSNMFFRAVEK